MAIESRNAAGVEPLRKYLDAIDATRNFSELNAAIVLAVKELGNLRNDLFPTVSVTDTQDSTRKVMQLMTFTPMFSSEDYTDPDNEMIKAYYSGLISQLIAAGEGQSDAKRVVGSLLCMEKALADHVSSNEELGFLQSQTNRYTMHPWTS